MATKWVNRKGKEQEVEVSAICPYVNDKYKGITIEWVGTNGWGEYTIFIADDKISGDSECMDGNDDKRFLKALFDDILAQIDIMG